MPLIPSVVFLDHIWPAEFTACRFLQQAERKETTEMRRKWQKHAVCGDLEEFVKYIIIHNRSMCIDPLFYLTFLLMTWNIFQSQTADIKLC